MRRVLPAVWIVVLCWLAAPRVAYAQRVLVVRPPVADAALSEAFNRLRAELLLQDFEVQVAEHTSQLTPDELELLAQRSGAFAGIALARRAGGANADVCIADRLTGKISLRRLAIAGKDSPRVLAVRAVDLLRESLRELAPDERPPPDVVGASREPLPPAVRAFSHRSRFQIDAAGVMLSSLRDVSSGYGAALGVWYRPTPALALGLSWTGPLVGASYRVESGRAAARQELGQLRASYNLLPPGRWQLGPLLGAGIYHLTAQGEVTPPLRALTDSVWSFVGSGGVLARFELGRTLSLGASLQGLLLTPQPVLAVAENAEELGQPLLLGSLGLGASF